MGLLFVQVPIIAVFTGLGVAFSLGRGAFLIAGYNTAPKEEKAKYDERALCRFMGKLMFTLAACQGVMALGGLMDRMWLFGVGLAAFLVAVLACVIYANTGNRFKKRK